MGWGPPGRAVSGRGDQVGVGGWGSWERKPEAKKKKKISVTLFGLVLLGVLWESPERVKHSGRSCGFIAQ